MFGVFLIQGFYDKVYKQTANHVVVQAFPDLPAVLDDYKDGMTALEFLDFTDFGPNNEWILNKNIEDSEESITEKQANQFLVAMNKRLKANPNKMQLGVFFVAGHGMIHEGTQRVLLNQFCKQRKFYKLWPIEIMIRQTTDSMRNSYLIVTMACCREIFVKERHGNCVGANTKAEAQTLFDEIKELDE